jgi:hypothetical protein
METKEKEAFIRKKATENVSDPTKGKVLWSIHATRKLQSEDLRRQEVESALSNCEVIEEYPWLTRRLPDCLSLAFTPTGRPIHAVVALDEPNDRIFIVTFFLSVSFDQTFLFKRKVWLLS